MGSIPPLNQSDWEEVFSLYQQTPEFKIRNYDFTLSEFKAIFFWEYVHRMLGRLVGMVFLIPFIYFLVKKRFETAFLRKLLVLLALGAFQGFMGWYMVKSGLVKDPNVSHYRLAAHLLTAFLLYGITFWLMLDRYYLPTEKISKKVKSLRLSIVTLLVLITQIVYGAFVSGLKAGAIYNTFPKMGADWVAESVSYAFQKNGMMSLLENPASVQFLHRYLAYVVVILILFLWKRSSAMALNDIQKRALVFLLIALAIQVILGVTTLIMAVPVVLGVLHQLGGLILFTALIHWIFQIRRS